MFLSLLTADAAASHGHEFSSNRSPSPSKRSPIPGLSLARSPLRALSAPSRPKATVPVARSKPLHSVDNSSVVQAINLKRIPALDEDEKSESDEVVTTPRAVHVESIDQSFPVASTTQSSYATSEKRQRQRKPKTSFQLAHPPPRTKSMQKAKSVFSPNIVLQLFKMSSSKRPTPAFEAVQSSFFSPGLSRSCADLHPKRLGTEDIVILEAEKYGHDHSVDQHESSKWDGRKVLSVVCTCGPVPRVYIRNAVWQVNCLPNGRYDFVPINNGLHNVPEVRWVRARPRLGSTRGRRSLSTSGEPRLTFSTILPDSRRHPVIASITPTCLEILDEYSLPTGSSNSEASSICAGVESRADDRRTESNAGSTSPTLHTDEALREIICTTGAWVASQQGWSFCQTDALEYNGFPAGPRSRVPSAQSLSNSTTSRRHSYAGHGVSQLPETHPLEKPKALGRLIGVFRKRKDG